MSVWKEGGVFRSAMIDYGDAAQHWTLSTFNRLSIYTVHIVLIMMMQIIIMIANHYEKQMTHLTVVYLSQLQWYNCLFCCCCDECCTHTICGLFASRVRFIDFTHYVRKYVMHIYVWYLYVAHNRNNRKYLHNKIVQSYTSQKLWDHICHPRTVLEPSQVIIMN